MAEALSHGGASALQQFCILAKSAKGKACVALIQQVISSHNIFVFGELLDMPSIQELNGTEHQPYFEALRLFAFGDYDDYLEASSQLPSLSDTQIRKLRQLTIVSVAGENKSIPYDVLQQKLGIYSVRELEDLIIDCIYSGLIHARLDQRARRIEVQKTIGRDVKDEQLQEISVRLEEWCNRSDQLLASLEQQIERVNYDEASTTERKETISKEIEDQKAIIRRQIEEREIDSFSRGSMFDDATFGFASIMGKGRRHTDARGRRS